jgi:hypothetical protein
METNHWRLATTARLSQSSTMVVAVFGGAPASRVISAAVVEVWLLPPSGGLAQESPPGRRDGNGLLGNGG